MSPLRRVQLRQPFHRQRVERRDRIAHFAALNAANGVITHTEQVTDSILPPMDGFAQDAEFCGGHGSGVQRLSIEKLRACNINGPCNTVNVIAGVNFKRCLRLPINNCYSRLVSTRICIAFRVIAGDQAAHQRVAQLVAASLVQDVNKLGHLNLSSMGIGALMNTDYPAICGIASVKAAICGKNQSRIVAKGATQ